MAESVLNNKRLLAVDDEPDILETLKEQLDEFPGLLLDTATDYETGYHLLRSWTYDLVILDIMGVRGFDLLNAAVSLGFPTVMLTAHALSVEALKKSIRMGARAYIPKEKILFQGDFSLPAEGQPANDHVKALVPVLEKLKLDFTRYMNVHAPATPQTKADLWKAVGK